MNIKIVVGLVLGVMTLGACGGSVDDPNGDTVSAESHKGGGKSGRASHLVHVRGRAAVTEYYCWWNSWSNLGNGEWTSTATVVTSPTADCSGGGTIGGASVKLEHKITYACVDAAGHPAAGGGVISDSTGTGNGWDRQTLTFAEPSCDSNSDHVGHYDSIMSSTITWPDGSQNTIFNDTSFP